MFQIATRILSITVVFTAVFAAEHYFSKEYEYSSKEQPSDHPNNPWKLVEKPVKSGFGPFDNGNSKFSIVEHHSTNDKQEIAKGTQKFQKIESQLRAAFRSSQVNRIKRWKAERMTKKDFKKKYGKTPKPKGR